MNTDSCIKSQIKELSPVEYELSVVIPHQSIKSELDRAYQKLSGRVSLKGFRKGKAPRQVLEQYYRLDIEKEVLGKVLQTSYQKALEEHVLSPIAEPQIETKSQISPQEDFTYKAKVEVKPEITVKNWKNLAFEAPTFKIDPTLLDQEVELLRERQSTISPVTDRTVAAKGDLVELQIKTTLGGNTVSNLSGDSRTVEVGKGHFLKEVEETLPGKSVDQNFSIKATLPSDFVDKTLQNKEVECDITVKGLKTRIMPTLDDEFAKDVSDKFETLADLKKEISKTIEAAKLEQEVKEKRNQAIQALIDSNPIDVPKGLVQKQAEYAASRMLAQVPKDKAQDIWKKLGEQLTNEAKPNALKTVTVSLLCEALAKAENIMISDSDIDSELEQESKRMNVTKQQLKAYYKPDDIENLKYRLANEKALDLVIENAKIKSVEKPFNIGQ